MRVYVSGAMTGIKDLNYPAFNAEAARLRALGWVVINPAENPTQPSWHAYMKISVAQVAGCDLVAVLPGWTQSKGARMEVDLADALQIPVADAAEVNVGPEQIDLEAFA